MTQTSWPDYIDSLDQNGLAPLTREVQRWIWTKQHPASCKNQRFVVSRNEHDGLGAFLHLMGWQLGAALENDYILIYGGQYTRNGEHLVDTDCRLDQGVREDMDCVFEPISNCNYLDNTASISPDVKMINPYLHTNIPNNWFGPKDCPTVWKEKLAELHQGIILTETYYKKWWRTQSAAYLGRLNAATLRKIKDSRLKMSDHTAYFWDEERRVIANTSVEFPLPDGTANIHMRHGDKGSEMKLIPLNTYVEHAQQCVLQNPMSLSNRLFISSDDSAAIRASTILPEQHLDSAGTLVGNHWSIIVSPNVPRFAEINRHEVTNQVNAFGKTKMLLHWLQQIMMALECDAWIGTRASNWNSLIDELRCVWIAKCRGPFVEVGESEDWKDYFW